MLNWVRRCYKGMINVLFFVLIFVWAILGGGICYSMVGEEYAALGVFAGLVIGFFVNVFLFGMLATFIDIADSNEQILNILRKDAKTDISVSYTTDYSAEIEKFQNLYKQGVLTEEEFKAKEKQLLAKSKGGI